MGGGGAMSTVEEQRGKEKGSVGDSISSAEVIEHVQIMRVMKERQTWLSIMSGKSEISGH